MGEESIKQLVEFVLVPSVVSLWAYVSAKLKTKKHKKTVEEIEHDCEDRICKIEQDCKDKIIELEKKYSVGACDGHPEFCKARIVNKCMWEYDQLIKSVITESEQSYVRDLEKGMEDGSIKIITDQKDEVIKKHKQILKISFGSGRVYIHDLVVADDFDVSYVKYGAGTYVLNPAFRALCVNFLDGFYDAVWDTYGEMYLSSFYKMDFQKRRFEFYKNKPDHLTDMIGLMLIFNKLMGKDK